MWPQRESPNCVRRHGRGLCIGNVGAQWGRNQGRRIGSDGTEFMRRVGVAYPAVIVNRLNLK